MTKSRGRSSSNMMYIADLQMYTHSGFFSSQFPFICFLDHFDQLFRLLVFSRHALISSSLGTQCSSNLFFTLLHEINDYVYRLLSQHETKLFPQLWCGFACLILLENILFVHPRKGIFSCVSLFIPIFFDYINILRLFIFLLCTTLFLCHVLYALPRP